MICQNCGAQLEDTLTVCPYCGTENIDNAFDEHLGELGAIYSRTEKVKHMKEEIAGQATRITGYVALGVVLFFLLVLGVTFGVAQYRAVHALENQNRELAEMEEYYEQGDYEKVYELILKSDHSYRPSYEKYYRVGMAYHVYGYTSDYFRSSITYLQNGGTVENVIASALYDMFRGMYSLNEYKQEGYLYGEGDAIEALQEQYKQLLVQEAKLTEEEIEATMETWTAESSEEDLQELGKVSETRIRNGK